jgi:hypothetical protein
MTQTPWSPPTDTSISLAFARFTGLIEGYTGRSFALMARCETHYCEGSGPLQLSVFPISEVTGLTVDGLDVDPGAYPVHKANGSILHGGALWKQKVAVSYTAGYQDAPAEIRTALATLVESYLSGATGGVNELQAARKETVMGVSSIDYGTPGTAFAGFGDPYAELGPYTSVLAKYREPGMA